MVNYIQPGFIAAYRFGDIIQRYGPPTYITAGGGRAVNQRQQQYYYYLEALYVEQGFAVRVEHRFEPEEENPLAGLTLNEATRFEMVYFFTPTEEGMMSYLGDSYERDWLTPWQGFNDYAFYCKERCS